MLWAGAFLLLGYIFSEQIEVVAQRAASLGSGLMVLFAVAPFEKKTMPALAQPPFWTVTLLVPFNAWNPEGAMRSDPAPSTVTVAVPVAVVVRKNVPTEFRVPPFSMRIDAVPQAV